MLFHWNSWESSNVESLEYYYLTHWFKNVHQIKPILFAYHRRTVKNDQFERAQSDSYWWRNVNSWIDNSIILPLCRYNEKQRFLQVSFDDASCVIPYASFTYSVNVTLSVCGTFDVFDGHFDGQNRCATHLAHQMSVTIITMLNFDGDFVKLVDSDVTY